MGTPAQTKATVKYIKEHTRRFVLQCNTDKDSDVVEFLESQGNVNALLKRLIREEIAIVEQVPAPCGEESR